MLKSLAHFGLIFSCGMRVLPLHMDIPVSQHLPKRLPLFPTEWLGLCVRGLRVSVPVLYGSGCCGSVTASEVADCASCSLTLLF